jgi:uncharacterized repeat protein (TIGR01451 family)
MSRPAILLLTVITVALLFASGATLAVAQTTTSIPQDASSQGIKTQSQGASDSTSGKASPEAVTPLATTSTNNGFTLTKKVRPDTVAVGDKLTFTITETNNSGSGLLFNKGINDILPTGLKFVSATPPLGGSCSFDSSTRTVNCKGFSIADGDTATITVVVKAKQSGSFKNKANDTGFPGNKVTAAFTVK